jgi:Tfp pilus assembly protein FimT
MNQGVTWLEALVILVVIGIMAAIVLPLERTNVG